MTLQNFQDQLQAILTEPLPDNVVADELGNITPANKYRALRCSLLSQEIRRCAWKPEAKAEAWTLARQADETAARLYGSYMSPLPRFDSFVSGGHIVPAIQ